MIHKLWQQTPCVRWGQAAKRPVFLRAGRRAKFYTSNIQHPTSSYIIVVCVGRGV